MKSHALELLKMTMKKTLMNVMMIMNLWNKVSLLIHCYFPLKVIDSTIYRALKLFQPKMTKRKKMVKKVSHRLEEVFKFNYFPISLLSFQ